MEIQQSIIVIMLTAVICIFVGIITQSMYPSSGPDALGNSGTIQLVPKLARIMILGFVLIPWIFIVCVTDLYMAQSKIHQDMATYMACN